MTCLTQSGPCCYFFRVLKSSNIKALTVTSKCQPTTSEGAWVFFTAMPPAYHGSKFTIVRVLFTFLEVNLQHFVTKRDTLPTKSILPNPFLKRCQSTDLIGTAFGNSQPHSYIPEGFSHKVFEREFRRKGKLNSVANKNPPKTFMEKTFCGYYF